MIIHDLNEKDAIRCNLKMQGDNIIAKSSEIKNCIGCFGCWVKTPGRCVIKDDYMDTGKKLSKDNELKIISECLYGSYSAFIKNVIDRTISYILPDFRIYKGEMHHKLRYKNNLSLSVYFYGDNILEEERKTAEKLVYANSDNFGCIVKEIKFLSKKEMMEGKFNEYWSC